MGLFGKQPEPKELNRKWKLELKKEDRNLERQIRAIEVEEKKVQKSARDAAKAGQIDCAKELAKSLIHSRKAKERIYTQKARLHSVEMALQHQQATQRVMSAVSKSTDLMKSMNDLMKVPELRETAKTLGREMAKAGFIEDMMDDVFDTMDEDVVEEADAEVDKILLEITSGIASQLTSAPKQATAEPEGAIAEADDEDLESIKKRLESLKN